MMHTLSFFAAAARLGRPRISKEGENCGENTRKPGSSSMSLLFPARASLTPYQGGLIRSDQDRELNNKMAVERGKFNPCFFPSGCRPALSRGLQPGGETV
jgi:hypothetical protein